MFSNSYLNSIRHRLTSPSFESMIDFLLFFPLNGWRLLQIFASAALVFALNDKLFPDVPLGPVVAAAVVTIIFFFLIEIMVLRKVEAATDDLRAFEETFSTIEKVSKKDHKLDVGKFVLKTVDGSHRLAFLTAYADLVLTLSLLRKQRISAKQYKRMLGVLATPRARHIADQLQANLNQNSIGALEFGGRPIEPILYAKLFEQRELIEKLIKLHKTALAPLESEKLRLQLGLGDLIPGAELGSTEEIYKGSTKRYETLIDTGYKEDALLETSSKALDQYEESYDDSDEPFSYLNAADVLRKLDQGSKGVFEN